MAAALSAQPCATCTNASFRAPGRALVGDLLYSSSPVVADFDGDGNLDIAVVNGGGVTVFLGTGGGEFGPPLFTQVDYSPPITPGDFDEDGVPDLVTTGLSFAVPGRILFGGKTGLFRSGPSLPVLSDSLAVADFDRDGHLDVVVGRYPDKSVTLLRGDGHGNMTVVGVFPTGLSDYRWAGRLAVGDFNGDGFPDLAVGGLYTGSGPPGSDSEIALLLGSATGFGPPIVYQGHSTDIRVVDLDGDGHMDVLAGGGEDLELHRGDGAGNLGPIQTISMGSSTFSSVTLLGVADLDGNGFQDVIARTSESGDPQIRIRMGDGAGGFGPIRQFSVENVGALQTGDFDGDGLSDYLIVGLDSVYVAFNDGTGGISERIFPTAEEPSSIVAADFDGDGKLDVATGGYLRLQPDGLSFLYGDGFGGFSSPVVDPGSGTVYSLAAIDVDGDGHQDLVGTDYATGTWVRLNDGTGQFGPKISVPVTCNYDRPAISADLDKDGHPDLVWPCRTAIAVAFGDGTGHFAPPLIIDTIYGGAVAIADVHGDGHLDLVGIDDSGGGVATFRGDGARHFGSPIISPALSGAGIALADFDGDGRIDFAHRGFSNGYFLEVLYGDGTGGFRSQRLFPMSGGTQLIVVDANADGHPDVVTFARGTVEAMMNDGTGGFLPSKQFLTGNSVGAIAVGDFNSDGKPDVVALGAGSIAFLPNNVCVPRRLRVVPGPVDCNPPGTPIAPPVAVQLIDDGGNQVCAGGSVSTAILSAPPGTVLGGTTTRPVTGGGATFADLTLSQMGRSTLGFTYSGAASSTRASFSIGSPAPVAAIIGPATICGTESVTYDAGPAYQTYLWTLDGVPISRSRTATLALPSIGAHTLSVRVSVAGGCETLTSRTISSAPPQVLSAVPPRGQTEGGNPIVISGACFGPYVSLAIGGISVYQPYVTSDSSISALAPAHPLGTVDVVVTNSDGQAGTLVGGYTYAACSPPVPGNNGPICAGDTLQLTASTVPNAVYNWTGPGGFTSMQQNPTIPNASPSASGAYYVTATADGCTSTSFYTFVTVRPLPATAISAPAAVCASSSGNTASVAAAGAGATYAWSITNGTIVAGAGTRSIFFTAGTSGSVDLQVTVTDGHGCQASGSSSVPISTSCGFRTVALCRAVDTRDPAGPFGGPALPGLSSRVFALAGVCGIPASARAVVLNVAVTAPTAGGDLRLYPAGASPPLVSAINYSIGQTRANNAVIALGASADLAVLSDQPTGTVHLILDVYGYFE